MTNFEKKAEEIVRKLKAMLRERHDLLAGVHDNPFLQKPKLLEQPCPSCHTSGESINADLQTILPSLVVEALSEAVQGERERIEKVIEKLRDEKSQIENKWICDYKYHASDVIEKVLAALREEGGKVICKNCNQERCGRGWSCRVL